MKNYQIIEAMLVMARDDNQGVRVSTTVTDVHHVSRGTIVSCSALNVHPQGMR